MLHPEPDGSRGSKLFALFLGLTGVLACGMMMRDAYRAWRSRDWPAVPCTILASAVEEQNGERPYRLHLLYRYQWRGRQHIGKTLRKGAYVSSNVADIERLVRAYPKDAGRICFVDPDNPAASALERDSVREGIAGVVLLATLIALLGRLYIFPSRSMGERVTLGELPIGKPTAFLLCLFVASVGIFGFAWMTALPICKSVAALGWIPTPCTVASSRVRTKILSGEYHVMTWWPDVVFRYRVNGRDYRANTVNFTDLPTPWYYGERGIAALYRWGAAATCFVNPNDPFEAVLGRQPSVDLWFGVWPLITALIGTGGMIELASNRKIRFGRPEDWGRLSLWSATYFRPAGAPGNGIRPGPRREGGDCGVVGTRRRIPRRSRGGDPGGCPDQAVVAEASGRTSPCPRPPGDHRDR